MDDTLRARAIGSGRANRRDQAMRSRLIVRQARPALADDLIALQRQPKPKLSPATQGSMYGHDNVGFHHH
jgi:hypothetical protein